MNLRLNIFLALACGLAVANIYYAQPILGEIALSLGMEQSASGITATCVQMGYCLGILLLVPLGDMLENRRLMTGMFLFASLALLAAGVSPDKLTFLGSVFLVGVSCSVVQMIIPYGVGMADENKRGSAMGIIGSGGILGIALARPVSSLLTALVSWRLCFLLSAVLMLALGLAFRAVLPTSRPVTKTSYPGILASMLRMFSSMTVLRLRLLFMALVFTAFSLFWATVPMVLRNELGFSQGDVTWFSTASIAATVGAVLAGRLADRGLGFKVVSLALLMAGTGFLLTPLLGMTVTLFALSVLLLDSGVHINNVITQQSILAMNPGARSRLNGLAISCAFVGGAAGSALGPWMYAHYGWPAAALAGFSAVFLAAAVHLGTRHLALKVLQTRELKAGEI